MIRLLITYKKNRVFKTKKKSKIVQINYFFLFFLFYASITTNLYGQFSTNHINSKKGIDLKNSNSWSIGLGFSNFIMLGDLRSLDVGNSVDYFNSGGFINVDKMFNPLLGIELKLFYTQISGGAKYFNNNIKNHSVSYANGVEDLNNLNFKGRSYGAELNLIFSFTNLYQTKASKWNITGYFGVGHHQYNSALYEFKNGENVAISDADFGNNLERNSVNEASSIYISTQIGLKRRISKRIDLDFRFGMYFNYEDHLDAAISRKQDWESFFINSIGITYKLGNKKTFILWEDDIKKEKPFKIIDSDKDGVMDQLDAEPNTPKGVMVYGNGKAVDSDKDDLPDYKDNCPLEYGPIINQGCPYKADSDGDGILDSNDLCPNIVGLKKNRGCPEKTYKPENVALQISLLATSIYFDSNRDKIKNISYATIDKIVVLIKNTPKLKFIIEGHTDNENNDRHNLYLSQKRAENVRRYMIRQGVNQKRIKTIGYGESRPKYSNETIEGKQLNRRVEIISVNSFN